MILFSEYRGRIDGRKEATLVLALGRAPADP
jgi:hypothetical protein